MPCDGEEFIWVIWHLGVHFQTWNGKGSGQMGPEYHWWALSSAQNSLLGSQRTIAVEHSLDGH